MFLKLNRSYVINKYILTYSICIYQNKVFTYITSIFINKHILHISLHIDIQSFIFFYYQNKAFTYIYIYIYTYIHIYIYTYIHSYIHKYLHIFYIYA